MLKVHQARWKTPDLSVPLPKSLMHLYPEQFQWVKWADLESLQARYYDLRDVDYPVTCAIRWTCVIKKCVSYINLAAISSVNILQFFCVTQTDLDLYLLSAPVQLEQLIVHADEVNLAIRGPSIFISTEEEPTTPHSVHNWPSPHDNNGNSSDEDSNRRSELPSSVSTDMFDNRGGRNDGASRKSSGSNGSGRSSTGAGLSRSNSNSCARAENGTSAQQAFDGADHSSSPQFQLTTKHKFPAKEKSEHTWGSEWTAPSNRQKRTDAETRCRLIPPSTGAGNIHTSFSGLWGMQRAGKSCPDSCSSSAFRYSHAQRDCLMCIMP